MKELNVVQMEEISGRTLLCSVVAGVAGGLLCGFWYGVGADLLFCSGPLG